METASVTITSDDLGMEDAGRSSCIRALNVHTDAHNSYITSFF